MGAVLPCMPVPDIGPGIPIPGFAQLATVGAPTVLWVRRRALQRRDELATGQVRDVVGNAALWSRSRKARDREAAMVVDMLVDMNVNMVMADTASGRGPRHGGLIQSLQQIRGGDRSRQIAHRCDNR
jgi:hypothetical protein